MYQALYRKYRPQTFDEVVGQSGVTQTLKMQLQTGRLSHAYLFTGSRGTGKTSCAKILAKAVNCEHPEDGNPCNRCAACRAIDEGSCMDVLEIDAASNNGVDNVRTLRDDAIYSPAEVRMRVYIIDEVHMLSLSAFNALLKTIEEPPAHLLFILATTELHKVPATILSRCQRFSFRRLMPEDIAGRINECAWREGIEIDQPAIALLSRLADGAMRDGMSLLDQCASATQGPVTVDSIYRCLGLAGAQSTVQMLSYAAEKATGELLKLFSELYAAGKDLGAMVDELTALCRDLLILKTAPRSGMSLISGVCSPEELNALLPKFTAEALLRMTELLQQTASGFNRTANRRIDVELCLIRLCDDTLTPDVQSIASRLSRLETQAASGMLAVPAAVPVPKEAAPLPLQEAPKAAAPTPVPPEPDQFWEKLCVCVLPQIGRDAAWLFRPEAGEAVLGRLQNDILRVYAKDNFTLGLVKKYELPLSQCAARLLGRPVRLVAALQSEGDQASSDSLESLLQFAQQHPDIVHIK